MTTDASTSQDNLADTAEVEAIVTFVAHETAASRILTANGETYWLKERNRTTDNEPRREGQTLLCRVREYSPRIPVARPLPILVFAGCPPGESVPEFERRGKWKLLSDAHIADANADVMSPLGRDDSLFEAGYLAVLQILGPRVTFGAQHPDPALILTATRKCGLSSKACGPAYQFLAKRYDRDYRERVNAESLHAWALQMRYSAGWQ